VHHRAWRGGSSLLLRAGAAPAAAALPLLALHVEAAGGLEVALTHSPCQACSPAARFLPVLLLQGQLPLASGAPPALQLLLPAAQGARALAGGGWERSAWAFEGAGGSGGVVVGLGLVLRAGPAAMLLGEVQVSRGGGLSAAAEHRAEG
jgi:hypothetical protein